MELMTFEEWWQTKPMYKDLKEAFEATFNAARLGTIPAENAIEVPEVGDWPEWAKGVRLYYTKFSDTDDGDIVFIPRPVPVFVPGYYWVRTKIGGKSHPQVLDKFDPAYIIGPKIENRRSENVRQGD